MEGLTISVIALAVAVGTFGLSWWSLVTRHRPFLWISDARVAVGETRWELHLTINNRGLVIAKNVQLKVWVFDDTDQKDLLEERALGALFPEQRVTLAISTVPQLKGRDSNELLFADEPGVFIETRIEYHNPGDWVRRWPARRTVQKFQVRDDRTVASSPNHGIEAT